MAGETATQHVYYLKLNREVGLLSTAKPRKTVEIHADKEDRVCGRQLDQIDRFH